MLDYFPKYFTNKAIGFYFAALILISVLFFNNILHLNWWIFGIIEVIMFFYFSNFLSKKWSNLSEKTFLKKLFATGLIIRIVWVTISYFLFIVWTGLPFEWHTGDAKDYHALGEWIAQLVKEGNSSQFFDYFEGQYSDSGYAGFLGLQYTITGGSIYIARIVKSVLGALMGVFIYKLSARTFGESTGRIAGILVMLMPSLIYYTGLHLKETEMVFILIVSLERIDALIRLRKFQFNTLWLPLLLVVLLFFFRTVLAISVLFSFGTTFLLTSERVMKFGKRFVIGFWVFIALGYFLGTQYAEEISEVWSQRSTSQERSMEWRATREGGNTLARYASTVVFAPLILVIPFPTMTNIPGQEIQMFMNGGNFVKNLIAFFVLYALYCIFKEKKWREYLLVISFILAYLAILSMSAFAQSERFHQPVIPFLLVMASYGISKITNKQKGIFNYYLVFMLLVAIGWNWFKLSGRGLI